jgi:hypothetical protein
VLFPCLSRDVFRAGSSDPIRLEVVSSAPNAGGCDAIARSTASAFFWTFPNDGTAIPSGDFLSRSADAQTRSVSSPVSAVHRGLGIV